ncbi:hypothetical protein B0H17DRAFT_1104678 [Mycena rosella]|uniref:Secreted protein n=1 Tax=Mycena rosella TaxID=1033263 RepID=A0AAD7FXA6_MYCRO|nr:hypothetical protein B0H17DRAFT_1104678 [Mycena rosella]
MVGFLWPRILVISTSSACMMVWGNPIAMSQSRHESHAVADVSVANRLRRQIFFADYVDTEEDTEILKTTDVEAGNEETSDI